jgi:hypothetical protein
VAAPIVVDVAPTTGPAGDPGLAGALIDSCSAAAGPGGCVLDEHTPVESRARVLVTFDAAQARVRVEVLAPVASDVGRAREVSFRNDDPALERFRATGLIVAGLVSDLTTREPVAEAPRQPPSVVPPIVSREPSRPVLLHLGGEVGWNGARPWTGVSLGADVALTTPVFLVLAGSYDQTWARDARGIAAQRSALAVGAGLAAPLAGDRLEVRLRVTLELQALRASILQPATLREDDGSRTLTGTELGADLILPIAAGIDAFCGGGVGWWGGRTTVLVQSSPDEVIGAWMVAVALGLDVGLP